MTAVDLTSDATRAVNRRVAVRLIPFLGLLMFVAYFDRISLSYAAPNGLNEDLGLSATMFGFAAGIFFFGYILLEVPSNLALHRFGARRWLARIIVSWGVVQVLTTFAPNATSLYVLRFLLGVTEAGFAPGVILYLTYWFTHEYRARAVSRFLFSVMVASVLGAPISLWLITVGDQFQPFGLVGWRFLILATGIPAIVLGVVAWFYLDDGPERAAWLTRAEKDDIARRVAEVEARDSTVAPRTVTQVLRSRKVWTLGLCYFSFAYGAYALTFFLPTIVAGFQEQFDVQYGVPQIALLTAIPFVFGGAAQLWFGRHADRKGFLGTHVAVSAIIGIAGGIAASMVTSPIPLIACICLMAIGVTGGTPLILVLASKLHTGANSASAIAIVNSIGISSGFFAPYLTGWLRDLTGANTAGILVICTLLLASGTAALLMDRDSSVAPAAEEHRPVAA